MLGPLMATTDCWGTSAGGDAMTTGTTTGATGRRGQLDGWTNPLRDARDKRLPRIAGPSSLVIFGVTGDLSRKKLMPAVYDLANRGLVPPDRKSTRLNSS